MASETGGATATRKRAARKPGGNGATTAAAAGGNALKDAAGAHLPAGAETMTFTGGGLEITVRHVGQQAATNNRARSGTKGKARARGT